MRYYFDTEFNGMGGALISLAVVSEVDADHGIYLYTRCPNPKPWVRQHVIPHLLDGADPTEVSKSGFGKPLAKFLDGDTAPVLVCNWPDDIRHVCQIIKHREDLILNRPNFSFEIAQAYGGHEEVTGAVAHNAWWDAVVLRHVVLRRPNVTAHA